MIGDQAKTKVKTSDRGRDRDLRIEASEKIENVKVREFGREKTKRKPKKTNKTKNGLNE